ncbi:peptidylprolyl isomerase [Xanthomonas campestris]|uniref:peptidylprolyl isomerase n=1 Tax=Xanthomonas campestris TaxID=339 RepID=UPI002359B1D0|nr:peptidylprolyl isomerase [Xanthomonas campestris]MDC8747104.1 peptidylprolyl isomerase [Xanthomonas campestris]
MSRSLLFYAAVAACLIAPASGTRAASVPTDGTAAATPVLRIGNHAFTAGQYRMLALADQPQDSSSTVVDDPGFVRDFADRVLWAEQARREHLQDTPAVAARIQQATDVILAAAAREHAGDGARVDAATIQHHFLAHPHDYDQIQLSHLFIALQPQTDARQGKELSDAQALARARALKQQLDAGADFATLAKSESDDTSTAAEGGELSEMFARYLDPRFAEAVQHLQAGQVSEPVRGAEGYHLIRMQAKTLATLETASGQIGVELRERAAEQKLQQLRADNPLQFDPAGFDAAMR